MKTPLPPNLSEAPCQSRLDNAFFSLHGEMGRRLQAVTEQWILPAPYANPGMLEMFRLRDRKTTDNMVPWAGEFAGKYLTHAVQIWRLTRNNELEEHLRWFVSELVSLQAEDGYLGPWPKAYRLLNHAPTPTYSTQKQTWDAWGHYHIMIGLILWYELTEDKKALACVQGIADLFVRRFLYANEKIAGELKNLLKEFCPEMNQAPIHSLLMLYKTTGKEDYLALGRKIVDEFAIDQAGDYYHQGLNNVPFFKTPKPRWESLHPIMGLVELYYVTGNSDYRQAFENLWWSMLEGDRHNNGGFTSGEEATGNPYNLGAIETCCTVAWSAISLEMLKLTGNSIVADELELSLYNSGFGMMSPSGRWVTYNTPMQGDKQASAHRIVFQSRAGTPELNCCSVNGPRILGLVSEWGIMDISDGLAINYYGPCSIECPDTILTQVTEYPKSDTIKITVAPSTIKMFTIALRIPQWSKKTSICLNGDSMDNVTPGTYYKINRKWKKGDTLTITFDFSLHFWIDDSNKEKQDTQIYPTSIYRGPILMACDNYHQNEDYETLPVLYSNKLNLLPTQEDRWLKPWMLFDVVSAGETVLKLCDFASAGNPGTTYESWIPISFDEIPKNMFSPKNTLRTFQV